MSRSLVASGVMRTLLTVILLAAGLSLASPSVFPENAGFANLGFGRGLVALAGAEFVLPVEIFDASAGLTVHSNFTDDLGLRLSGSALLFPAVGTTPPLALGLGADLGYSSQRGFNFHLGPFNFHLGPLVGTDLLFSLDLPMTVSAYLGLGYAANTGLSLAWAAQLRYYFELEGEDVAIELSSSDLALLSLGVRVFF